MIKRILAAIFICFLVYAQVTSIPSAAGGGGAGDVTGSANLTTPGAMVVVSGSGSVKQVSGGLCEPYYTSATVIGIRACAYGVGSYAYTSVASCATSATPASSGTLFVYLQKDGTPILGYSGTNVTGCTGWTTEQSVTGYPDDSIPIGTFTWAASAWSSSFTDDRRFITRDVYEFSNGINCTTTLGVTSCVSDLPVATAQAGTPWKVDDTSASTTTYTGCPTPAVTLYSAGMSMWFKPASTNTGSSTLNVCALGAKTIQKLSSGTLTNLASGDMDSDSYSLLTYNGTVFVKVPLEGSGTGVTPSTRNAIASRPTCDSSIAGQIFVATDGIGLSSQCNGTSWFDMIYGVPITRPTNAASWTLVNGGTLADANGFPVLTKATTGLAIAVKTQANVGFTATLGFIMPYGGADNECGIWALTGQTVGTNLASGWVAGIQATAPMFRTLGRLYNPINGTIDNNSMTPSGNPYMPQTGGIIWLRVTRSTTDFTGYIGDATGGTWTQIATGGSGLGATAITDLGFGCDPRGTNGVQMKVVHWDVQ